MKRHRLYCATDLNILKLYIIQIYICCWEIFLILHAFLRNLNEVVTNFQFIMDNVQVSEEGQLPLRSFPLHCTFSVDVTFLIIPVIMLPLSRCQRHRELDPCVQAFRSFKPHPAQTKERGHVVLQHSFQNWKRILKCTRWTFIQGVQYVCPFFSLRNEAPCTCDSIAQVCWHVTDSVLLFDWASF